MSNQEELIRQIKLAAANGVGHPGEPSTGPEADSTILQRLDRMIRAIREHETITSGSSPHLDQQAGYQQEHWRRQTGPHVSRHRTDAFNAANELRSSKSYQDVSSSSGKGLFETSSKSSASSSSHRGHHYRQRRSISRDSRPKSSYGRSASRTPSSPQQYATSTPDLLAANEDSASTSSSFQRAHSPEVMVVIQKSKSCANLANGDGGEDSEVDVDVGIDIESVDGDSLTDDAVDVLKGRGGRVSEFPRLPKKAAPNFSAISQTTGGGPGKSRRWYGNGSTSTVHHHHLQQLQRQQKGSSSRKLMKPFGPTTTAAANGVRQKVRMTLRYTATNTNSRRSPRSVKIFQQLTIGGNSILIYDGAVVAGGK